MGLIQAIDMIIKTKIDGKYIKVDVSYPCCPEYRCFSPHKYEHKGTTIDDKAHDWTAGHYTCSHRYFHGCPDEPERMGG